MAIKCKVIQDVTKKIKSYRSLLLYLIWEEMRKIIFKASVPYLILLPSPCTLKYFVITTFHIFQSHCAMAESPILVTQLNCLVNVYAEDINKFWTIDVTANITIIITMPLFRNFVILFSILPRMFINCPIHKGFVITF